MDRVMAGFCVGMASILGGAATYSILLHKDVFLTSLSITGMIAMVLFAILFGVRSVIIDKD